MAAEGMQINMPAAATEFVSEISMLELILMVADSDDDATTPSGDAVPRTVVELRTDPDRLNAF